MDAKQKTLAESLSLIAAIVPLTTDQAVRVAAVLDRLYGQSRRVAEDKKINWHPAHAACCPPRDVPGSHHLVGCPDWREPAEAEELLADAQAERERDAEAAYDAVMRGEV